MKRIIAIVLVVLLSNAFIYWITSHEKKREEAAPAQVQERVPETPPVEPRSLLLPAEAVEASRKVREADPKTLLDDTAALWKEVARRSLSSLVVVEAVRDVGDGSAPLPEQEEAAPLWHALADTASSGGLVLDDGFSILTTYDLISGASELRVRTLSGRYLWAEPVAADLVTRLAVIRVPERLSSDVRWGLAVEADLADAVMTLYLDQEGEARCIPAAVTGLGYESGPLFPGTVKSYLSLDLDDTQMMPGALVVNAEGAAIGVINSMGRAIMTEQVVFVADSLIRHGEVRRAWLGVQIQPLTPAMAPHFQQSGDGGFLVTAVSADSPAQNAGVVPGDVITRIQGQVIRNQGLFRAAISEISPGSRMNLTLLREGEAMEVTVTLGLLRQEPSMTVRWESEAEPRPRDRPLLNALHVEESDRGLVIRSVDLRQVALSAIPAPGALLLSINRQPVFSSLDYAAKETEIGPENKVLIEVNEGGRIRYLVMERLGNGTLPKKPNS